MNKKPVIVFFGGEPLGIPTLEELFANRQIPSLVVCNPDRPSGRKLAFTPPPVKVWAMKHDIPVIQPGTLKDEKALQLLRNTNADIFVVAAYSKIIPKDMLDIPKHGTLNIHPSLLPKLRGASPIRSAILEDMREEIGVSIMQMDEEMDHGPIVTQMRMDIAKEYWPIRGRQLDEGLAHMGGALLASVISDWIAGIITPKEQDHEKATFSAKIEKNMGEINLEDDAYQNLLKIRAFDGWPGTFFFHTKKDGQKVRVKITDAELNEDGKLDIKTVIPEGKKEMTYETFLKSMH